MLDDAFARLQSAEREAATSHHNDRPYPTEAQAIAGNYKHGWLTLHGLTIKIENVRNSIRSGTSADGKRWANRMAASYGEIVGTRGADGDPVDVFVGPFPESAAVWIINQGTPGGAFDEHKVVIGAGAERVARDLYLASYDVGWQGLQSIHPATVAQLKWWLRNGDLTKPFTPQQLPLLDGAQSTMEKTLWTPEAEPIGKTLPALMYALRSDDRDGLLLDGVSLAELTADALSEEGACAAPKPLLDALVIPVSRMTLRMEQLQRVMNAAGGELQVAGYTIADPIKARGVLQVAVQFELSDGQAITVWFHNPDTTPAKLTPLDELVSWKWMLNKKDITVVVAPEKGRELNPREVGRRVMKLAERNSARFAEANKALAEKAAAIEALRAEIPALEERLAEVQGQVDAARAAKEAAAAAAEAEANDPRAEERRILTAEGYASIRNDEAALLNWQDVLDSHFQGRLIEFRNALRGLGWDGEAYQALAKGDVKLVVNATRVGAGSNVVGLTYLGDLGGGIGNGILVKAVDDLALTPGDLAAKFNADVDEALARRSAQDAAALLAEANAQAASLAGIEEFLATLPDERTRARARQTLNKLVRSGGSPVILKDFIIKRIDAGYVAVNDGMYGPILRSPDGAFVEQSKITKFGMDFARFLLAKRRAGSEEAEIEEMGMGPDRSSEPGKTIGALSDELMLLGWKIESVRKGFSAISARGSEVVVEPDATYPNAIEIKGSAVTIMVGGDAKRAADNIDAEDYGASISRFHDGERIEDEDDPFNGLKLEFVRAIERIEEGAAKAGMQVAWGNFDASLSTGSLFDAVSQAAEDAARPGVVCAQIGRVGVVIARASIDEDGVVTFYPGSSGSETGGTETTVSGIAAMLGTIEAGRTSTIDPQPDVAPAKAKRVTKKEANEAYDTLSYRVNDLAGHTELEFFKANVPETLAGPMAAVQALLDRGWPDTIPPTSLMERAAGMIERWRALQASGLSGDLGRGDAWRYLKDAGMDDAAVDAVLAKPSSSRTANMGALGGEVDVPSYTLDYLNSAIDAWRKASALGRGAAGDEVGASWTRSTTVERTAWLMRAGYGYDGKLTLSAQTIVNKAWVDMRQVVKDKLIAAADAVMAGKLADETKGGDPVQTEELAPERDRGLWEREVADIIRARQGNESRTEANELIAKDGNSDMVDAMFDAGKTAQETADALLEKQAAAAVAAEPEPAAVAAAEESIDPQRAADAGYLNSLIDGTGDLLAADTFERLEPMFTTYADDADMMALLERAATAYGDAAQAAARAALQPA